jgi:hypothetical protein
MSVEGRTSMLPGCTERWPTPRSCRCSSPSAVCRPRSTPPRPPSHSYRNARAHTRTRTQGHGHAHAHAHSAARTRVCAHPRPHMRRLRCIEHGTLLLLLLLLLPPPPPPPPPLPPTPPPPPPLASGLSGIQAPRQQAGAGAGAAPARRWSGGGGGGGLGRERTWGERGGERRTETSFFPLSLFPSRRTCRAMVRRTRSRPGSSSACRRHVNQRLSLSLSVKTATGR